MNNGIGFGFGVLMVFLVVVCLPILLFFVFRAIVLWYWKIDEIVKSLKSIESHLIEIKLRENPVPTINRPADPPLEPAPAGPPPQSEPPGHSEERKNWAALPNVDISKSCPKCKAAGISVDSESDATKDVFTCSTCRNTWSQPKNRG